jgi:2-C-methyl-D-erythritol 2,4-cyclodiphosphate synthase
MAALRVGVGFDIHPYADDPDRPLILAGVTFPGERGLAGHSDADVVAHAVADAILGASGLGDLGLHFPDSDAAWRGAAGDRLLAETVRLAAEDGWQVVNVDCSVVLEAPRLAPHRATMADRLAAIVGGPVSVKAKRAEGLGALGRQEGIACFAVTLLEAGG